MNHHQLQDQIFSVSLSLSVSMVVRRPWLIEICSNDLDETLIDIDIVEQIVLVEESQDRNQLGGEHLRFQEEEEKTNFVVCVRVE